MTQRGRTNPMRTNQFYAFYTLLAVFALASCQSIPVSNATINEAFAGREGAFVLMDCASGATREYRPDASARPLPPCSTFKICNTLVGLECEVISSPNEMFYRWDGVARSIPDWNRDLTLKEAFQVSCVPGYQELARKIGKDRMQTWIETIGYGNRDTSAGLDVFWLPAPGRRTILITPREQAGLIRELVSGKLPFSPRSRGVLKEIMRAKETERGVLYGKTGSGTDATGTYVLGWYVGYVENGGKTYAFACAIQGDKMTGRDARAIIETILMTEGLL